MKKPKKPAKAKARKKMPKPSRPFKSVDKDDWRWTSVDDLNAWSNGFYKGEAQ